MKWQKQTNTNCKIYVKSFSVATTADMEDYMKPSVRKSPDHFILHVGTNDLSANKSPLETANEIINLACKLKTESHDVSVSTIILRGDNKKLNEKGCEVNSHLKELCKEKNIYLIDNSKKIKLQHLNKGKLHLTKYGSRILSNNFIGNICKIFNSDCNTTLKNIHSDNINKLIFAHLHINSIRNKSEVLADQVKGKIDVLMISETKIDESFPQGNFLIDGFSSLYRLNRDSKVGGIMLYIREDVPSNFVASDNKPIESLYVELNLQNVKMLINCSYNPHKADICNHLPTLNSFLDVHSTKYEKIFIMGDFNVEIDDPKMQTFCEVYNFKSLIKQPTCYKNPIKPSCIDLMLTNFPRMFQSTCVIETGLSDFHLTAVTVLRKTLKKVRPRIINCRSFKHFSNEACRVSLKNNLSNEVYVNNDNGLERFCKTAVDTLNKIAPIKKKYARGNQMPFMIKELSKEKGQDLGISFL